jgi:hypothetical protein
MDIFNLTPEQLGNFEKNVIIKLKEIVEELRIKNESLIKEYEEEVEILKKENVDRKEELDKFGIDVRKYKSEGRDRVKESKTKYSEEELDIIKRLLQYEKYLINFVNQLFEINKEQLSMLSNLWGHSNFLKRLTNNLSGAHNVNEFIARVDVIKDRRNRIVKTDKNILHDKERLLEKKEKLNGLIHKILRRKKHLLNKLEKDDGKIVDLNEYKEKLKAKQEKELNREVRTGTFG